jgi:AcrR family transcriptional regulator
MPTETPPTAKRAPTGAALFSSNVTDAITAAVMEEMAEKGYNGMSMDSVARSAGVGKGAIYRRWSSKEEMTVDVISDLIVLDDVEIDTGSLHDDLRSALGEMNDWLSDPRVRKIYVDLLANGMRNSALADALTTHIGLPRRARGMRILDQATARGELSESIDREMVLDLIGAPVFWRLVARREGITPSYLDALAALLTGGIRAIA